MDEIVYVFDIDGTLLDPGDYFTKNPFPKEGKRGQKKYDAWLNKAEKYLNKYGTPIPGMSDLVNLLSLCKDVYYLTSKQEYLRDSTLNWLYVHGFPFYTLSNYLVMRPKYELRSYGAFKTMILKELEKKYNTIVMFDDDPKGLLEKEFKKHPNWTLIKAITGGKLP